MKPQALEVFKIFERTHGESAAKTIIEYLVNADTMAIEREINSRIEHLATKDDLNDTKHELNSVKADLIKWMFIFWVGQVVATFSFIMLFLKK
jgi:hypothetical protein